MRIEIELDDDNVELLDILTQRFQFENRDEAINWAIVFTVIHAELTDRGVREALGRILKGMRRG